MLCHCQGSGGARRQLQMIRNLSTPAAGVVRSASPLTTKYSVKYIVIETVESGDVRTHGNGSVGIFTHVIMSNEWESPDWFTVHVLSLRAWPSCADQS